MQVLFYILLVINVLLVILSGVSKVLLMQQEIDMFGEFGFSNIMLIVFGAAQCIAGITMAIPKTRLFGIAITVLTYILSAAILYISNDVFMALISIVFIAILAWLASFHRKTVQATQQIKAE